MDTRIYLSKQAKENPQETMGILQQAASEVFSESEQNFDVIRNKHWYKRLFELLTFSRNNEKVLAKNVASISKIQEIIVKTLLLLSVQNTNLSGDIRNLTEGHRLLPEQVYRLSNTQYKLANYIIELKYGGKKELLISNLIDHKKSVIIGVYTSFVYENKKLASKTSKDFTAALYKAFGTNTPEKRDDSDFDKLLSDGERELLYKLLQSWWYLATDNFCERKFFDSFTISNNRKSELCEQIRTSIDNQGVENYINWYATQEALYEDDFNIIDDVGIELEATDTGIVKCYIDFDDEGIRCVIAQLDVCLGEDKLDINNPNKREEITKRINRVNPDISEEAVVGIYNCGGDVILTTHAMYAGGKKFAYNRLNEKNVELGLADGEKYRLSLPNSDYNITELEIDADIPALKEMLLKLAKLQTASTDEAVLFKQLTYSQRADFYRIMLFVISDSKLPVFDAYAKIFTLEKEQADNRFGDFITQPIDLPADTSEYRETIWRFFTNVPYPSRKTISRWAMATVLGTLSVTKWSSNISDRESDLVFGMDYANVGNDEDQRKKLLAETTLEPSFIDKREKKLKRVYYNNHSKPFNTPKRIAADVLSSGAYEGVRAIKENKTRKELIRAHLIAYDSIADMLFKKGMSPVGVTENEREAFDKRVEYLRNKL